MVVEVWIAGYRRGGTDIKTGDQTWISKGLKHFLLMHLKNFLLMYLSLVVLISCAHAQVSGAPNPSGGVFIAIDDGTPRQCININTSVVSMFVIGIKARQNTSWLPSWIVSTSNVGAKINITMLDPLTQNPSFTFPRAVKLKPNGSSNIVTLPVRYTLLTKFSFINTSNNPAHPISNVALDMDFINIEKSGALATVMSSLIDFSKNLPLPPNPYSTGVQLFGQFANSLIQQAAAGSTDDVPLATMSYDLSTLDSCGRRELMEGTTALILDYKGGDTNGVIATSDAGKYCYFLGSNDEVTYAAKSEPTLDCDHQTGMARVPKTALNNPQIVYAVFSYSKQGTSVAVRFAPVNPSVTAHSFDSAAVSKLAENLQENHLGYDANTITGKKNIEAWGLALNHGISALPSDLVGENEGQSIIRLPASRAIEYDTARSIARCDRIGISADQCP
jgi:hypothetical protein